ncbi:ABC transporter permease [Virgibacillus soli]|uniref:ABC transporter permease n=1 Tax=Lederbergia galactosidilytica TaxID=217031 RepID=A0A0Q9Y4G1_9BACI|nr:ABC transporter permease [Lederbergia galactosidilytica]KRG12703.1 ABC transporter permease [Virgibacillus soli]MBP1916545.1 putative aldouronate transport system permease protein [Lederbergia galactosidilytica]OAK71961.1 ABC transporter permease [Lederbergia galactosidilytica]
MHKMHNTTAGRIFDVFNFILLGILGLATVVPFLYIIAGSFATESELATRPFFIIPETFTTQAYQYIFSTDSVVRSLGVSVFVTIVGTLISLILTLTFAYPLSRKEMMGRNVILNLILFSMLFSGGMIPTYLLVKGLGLLDSLWALILPLAINPFYVIIVKTFFQELPKELEDASKMDGCSEIQTFWRVMLPLSKPVIATFTLFYAVFYWNDFFQALLYITDTTKWPIQLLLQQLVMVANVGIGDMSEATLYEPPEESIKLAVIVIATVPILLFYPFLQKHFAKGVMLGSVKG